MHFDFAKTSKTCLSKNRNGSTSLLINFWTNLVPWCIWDIRQDVCRLIKFRWHILAMGPLHIKTMMLIMFLRIWASSINIQKYLPKGQNLAGTGDTIWNLAGAGDRIWNFPGTGPEPPVLAGAGAKIIKIFPNQVENIYRCHPWHSTMFIGSPVFDYSW